MGKANPRCILKNPETDCLNDPTEQLIQSSGFLSTESTGQTIGIGASYLMSLVQMKPDVINKKKCGDVLGNKFVYEFGKCKDATNTTQIRYKYIDTTCKNSKGFIPCTFDSAYNTVISTADIPKSLIEDPTPKCKEVEVECKVSNVGSNWTGSSGPIHIANGDHYIPFGTSGFENLYTSINDYMKSNDLNFYNNEKKNNSEELKNDTSLNEMYYIMLMIFLLFIIYKLMHKK